MIFGEKIEPKAYANQHKSVSTYTDSFTFVISCMFSSWIINALSNNIYRTFKPMTSFVFSFCNSWELMHFTNVVLTCSLREHLCPRTGIMICMGSDRKSSSCCYCVLFILHSFLACTHLWNVYKSKRLGRFFPSRRIAIFDFVRPDCDVKYLQIHVSCKSNS